MDRPSTRVSRRAVTKAATAVGLTALLGSRAATARAATPLSARTLDITVSSPALGRSAPVRLILPSSFGTQTGRTYPVLYLLHGAHDDYTSWTRETDIEAFTEGRDLIVAMPDAGPTGIPSAWRGGPDYEVFQLTEVPALLARQYRASGVRAVAGVSTGGYGAMSHAARHPGMFAAAASYSGILDTMAPGVPPLVDAIVARENLAPGSLWGNPFLNLLTWRDFNPRSRAEGLRGTPCTSPAAAESSVAPVTGCPRRWRAPCGSPRTPSPTRSHCSASRSRPTTTRAEDTAGPTGGASSGRPGRCLPGAWGCPSEAGTVGARNGAQGTSVQPRTCPSPHGHQPEGEPLPGERRALRGDPRRPAR